MNDQPERRDQTKPEDSVPPADEAESGFIAQTRDLVLGLLHLLEHAGKRLFDDRCMQVAASLSFTTILSLVPFLAISLSFISAFSQFGDLKAQAETFITQNLLPQAIERSLATPMTRPRLPVISCLPSVIGTP